MALYGSHPRRGESDGSGMIITSDCQDRTGLDRALPPAWLIAPHLRPALIPAAIARLKAKERARG